MKRSLLFWIGCICAVLCTSAQSLHPDVGPNGKYGYRDVSGEWRIAPQFDKAAEFSKDLPVAVVAKGKLKGVIDMKGRFVIGCFYNELGKEFVSGVIEACQNNQWGYIDLNGQIIVPLKYTQGKCRDNFSKAAKKVRGLRKDRRYEIVERRIQEAAESVQDAVVDSPA